MMQQQSHLHQEQQQLNMVSYPLANGSFGARSNTSSSNSNTSNNFPHSDWQPARFEGQTSYRYRDINSTTIAAAATATAVSTTSANAAGGSINNNNRSTNDDLSINAVTFSNEMNAININPAQLSWNQQRQHPQEQHNINDQDDEELEQQQAYSIHDSPFNTREGSEQQQPYQQQMNNDHLQKFEDQDSHHLGRRLQFGLSDSSHKQQLHYQQGLLHQQQHEEYLKQQQHLSTQRSNSKQQQQQQQRSPPLVMYSPIESQNSQIIDPFQLSAEPDQYLEHLIINESNNKSSTIGSSRIHNNFNNHNHNNLSSGSAGKQLPSHFNYLINSNNSSGVNIINSSNSQIQLQQQQQLQHQHQLNHQQQHQHSHPGYSSKEQSYVYSKESTPENLTRNFNPHSQPQLTHSGSSGRGININNMNANSNSTGIISYNNYQLKQSQNHNNNNNRTYLGQQQSKPQSELSQQQQQQPQPQQDLSESIPTLQPNEEQQQQQQQLQLPHYLQANSIVNRFNLHAHVTTVTELEEAENTSSNNNTNNTSTTNTTRIVPVPNNPNHLTSFNHNNNNQRGGGSFNGSIKSLQSPTKSHSFHGSTSNQSLQSKVYQQQQQQQTETAAATTSLSTKHAMKVQSPCRQCIPLFLAKTEELNNLQCEYSHLEDMNRNLEIEILKLASIRTATSTNNNNTALNSNNNTNIHATTTTPQAASTNNSPVTVHAHGIAAAATATNGGAASSSQKQMNVITELYAQIENLNEVIDDLKRDNYEITDEITSIRSSHLQELDEIKFKYASEIETLVAQNRKLQSINARNISNAAAISHSKHTTEQLESQQALLQSQLSALEAENASLTALNAAQLEDIKVLMRDKDVLHQRVNDLVAGSESKLQEFKRAHEHLRIQLTKQSEANLNQRIQELHHKHHMQVQKYKQQILTLTQQIQQFQPIATERDRMVTDCITSRSRVGTSIDKNSTIEIKRILPTSSQNNNNNIQMKVNMQNHHSSSQSHLQSTQSLMNAYRNHPNFQQQSTNHTQSASTMFKQSQSSNGLSNPNQIRHNRSQNSHHQQQQHQQQLNSTEICEINTARRSTSTSRNRTKTLGGAANSNLTSGNGNNPELAPNRSINSMDFTEKHLIWEICGILRSENIKQLPGMIARMKDSNRQLQRFADSIVELVVSCHPQGFFEKDSMQGKMKKIIMTSGQFDKSTNRTSYNNTNYSNQGGSTTAVTAVAGAEGINATPSLKQSWKWLKSIMEEFMSMKTMLPSDDFEEQVCRLLNVPNKFVAQQVLSDKILECTIANRIFSKIAIILKLQKCNTYTEYEAAINALYRDFVVDPQNETYNNDDLDDNCEQGVELNRNDQFA